MKVITRFPPSPTGQLHVGGLRTALYNYVFAKQHKGTFVLRIEDTDQTRYVKGADKNIINSLIAFGLNFDEGPTYQSKQLKTYKKYADQLVEKGHAYKCFCTPERLEQMRKDQQAQKKPPMYDGTCRELTEEQVKEKMNQNIPHVIRMKVPEKGEVSFTDLVRGKVSFDLSTIDDQVILKSDGFPTYHLAHVVDDSDSGITHVIRGEEWLPSTPKHILLQQALGFSQPEYAHLPLLLNKDKSKLSKRQGDVSVQDYLDKGYLPEALLNFVALLGWNPGKGSEKEIYSLKELIKEFDIKNVHKGGAVFDIEKLDWINGLYIRELDDTILTEQCMPYLKQVEPGIEFAYAQKIVAVEKERLKKLSDISEDIGFFFADPEYDRGLLLWKKVSEQQTREHLKLLFNYILDLDEKEFTEQKLEKNIIKWIKKNNYGVGDMLWPMRVALSGLKNSPGPFEIAGVLGKKTVERRLQHAIDKLK